MLNLTWFTSTATNPDEDCLEMDISIGEGEGNQVKFSITRAPEQEPVAEFFLNKHDQSFVEGNGANFVTHDL